MVSARPDWLLEVRRRETAHQTLQQRRKDLRLNRDILMHGVRGHATCLGPDDSDDSEGIRILIMLMRGEEAEIGPPDMPGLT